MLIYEDKRISRVVIDRLSFLRDDEGLQPSSFDQHLDSNRLKTHLIIIEMIATVSNQSIDNEQVVHLFCLTMNSLDSHKQKNVRSHSFEIDRQRSMSIFINFISRLLLYLIKVTCIPIEI